jgi:hypothetical protein
VLLFLLYLLVDRLGASHERHWARRRKLGDELSLLYSWTDIQNSAFAGALALVWDGTVFSTPT